MQFLHKDGNLKALAGDTLTGAMEVSQLAARWNQWTRRYSREMNEFVSTGTFSVETMNSELKEKLTSAMSDCKRMNRWSSSDVRTRLHRFYVTKHIVGALIIALPADELQEPRNREEMRQLYVRVFEKVRERIFDNLDERELDLFDHLKTRCLNGVYSHDPSFGPYIRHDCSVDKSRERFERFFPTQANVNGEKPKPQSANLTFPWTPLSKKSFEHYRERVDFFRELHRDLTQALPGGQQFLEFLAHTDFEIGRHTLRGEIARAREVHRTKNATQSVKWITNVRGGLKDAAITESAIKAMGVLGNFGHLQKKASQLRAKNQLLRREAFRRLPPPPPVPSPPPVDLTPISSLPEETRDRSDNDVHVPASQEQLIGRIVEKNAKKIGLEWSNWTLFPGAESNGRNSQGAIILSESFSIVFNSITRVLRAMGRFKDTLAWVRTFDEIDQQELSLAFFMWVTNVCRPGDKRIISYEHWLNERMEAHTQMLWTILLDIASEMQVGDSNKKAFAFCVAVEAVGLEYMKRFQSRTKAVPEFQFDLGVDEWRQWRMRYRGDLQLGASEQLQHLLAWIRKHGL